MRRVLRFFARYARPYLPHYLLGFVLLFATNYAVVRIPTLIGEALNELEAGGSAALTDSRWLAGELMVWALSLVFIRTGSRVLFFNPGREIEYAVGNDLFGHLLELPRPFFMRRKVGDIVSIATNDIQTLRLLVGFAGLQVCNVAVAIPLHLWQMLRTDWVLTLYCIGPIALGAVYMRWTVQRFYGMVRHSLVFLGTLSDRILETYSGIGTIRAHGVEEQAEARFQERNQAYLDLQIEIASVRAFSMPVLAFTGLLATGVVLWIGGQRVIDGDLQVGHMATFTALLISMISLLTSLAWVLAAISRGTVALGRVDDLLQEKPELPIPRYDQPLAAPPALVLRELGFSYPGADAPALEGISATVRPGETLGIFGKTGAGKTTLINLLARVYEPPPGTVLLGEVDARDIELGALRQRMAVVPQDPFLFSTTLRDNIRLLGERTGHQITADAREDDPRPVGLRRRPGQTEGEAFEDIGRSAAPDPRLQRVLDDACLEEDLRALPQGLDTVVGERGVMLSGGQRQRAALARALYREPVVLLLDDVLSAVDQRTEARLVAAIRRLGAQHEVDARAPTTVVVSHRTSVLEHADEILVLDGGRVVERGTHAELLERGGAYADAHAHQVQEQAGVSASPGEEARP